MRANDDDIEKSFAQSEKYRRTLIRDDDDIM